MDTHTRYLLIHSKRSEAPRKLKVIISIILDEQTIFEFKIKETIYIRSNKMSKCVRWDALLKEEKTAVCHVIKCHSPETLHGQT